MGYDVKIESTKLKDGPDGVWVDRTNSAYMIFGGCTAESYWGVCTCSGIMCQRAAESESLPRPMVFSRIKDRFSSSLQILVLPLTYSIGITGSETWGIKKIP